MSISGQNLSIVIVTLKSNQVIHQCIKSINHDLPIIIIENSSDINFKQDLEKMYKNLTCILSKKNLGMGNGNNLGIKFAKTDYVLILNPDVILEKHTIENLIKTSQKISEFAILSPISTNKDFPNYKMFKTTEAKKYDLEPFMVKSVDGYAMLLNKKEIEKILIKESSNKDNDYFDKNIFMYLENDDLCKRIIHAKKNIFIDPQSRINHLGGSAVDKIYEEEVELSRNWHWMWSKFYFNKKHYGFLKAFANGFPKFFLTIFKYLFFLITYNNFKANKYRNRLSGFLNGMMGKPSWYRPKIND